MGKVQTWIAALLALAAIVSGVWDIYVIYKGEPNETVSAVLQKWSSLYPIFPFACGVIIGHIFWPGTHEQKIANERDAAAAILRHQPSFANGDIPPGSADIQCGLKGT